MIPASTCTAGLVISEFLASNGGGLRDEDLQSPAWVEISNRGPETVNLAGWRLTDDAGNLAKWTFPATNLAPGNFLVVFASGKNRITAGAPLHANFQLSNAGEYLALVNPEGTVVHAYAPAFPPQRQNVSYGIEMPTITTPLIGPAAVARVMVPADGALGTSWTTSGFDDSSWSAIAAPLEYSVGVTAQQVLAFDVNDRSFAPAGYTQAGFSSFVINSNVSNTAVQTQPTVRVFGGITVTLSNTPPFGYDDRLRDGPLNSGAFTESLLLRDFVYSLDNTGTGGLNLWLNGLTANFPHRFTVWSFDGQGGGNKASDWYADNVQVRTNYAFNSVNAPSNNSQYRFMFDAVAGGSGSILLSGRRNPATVTTGVYLNALRVERLVPQAPGNVLGAMMLSNNASIYIRIPFNVVDPGSYHSVKLRIRYDDGFVAYVNGQVVASRNAPGSPQWNSAAVAINNGTAVEEELVIPNSGLLQTGANVLAIHGLNASSFDSDFQINAELEGVGDGTPEERYFMPPTPGSVNGASYLGLVAETKCSVERGFYSTPFAVTISTATPSASICWTTNGSVPSPTNGFLYTGPIQISGTRLLRAAAYLDGHIPSIPETHSYIFLSQVLQQSAVQPGYPTVWQGNFPADYEMDPGIVNHPIYGQTISNDLRSIPTLSLVSSHEQFWSSSAGIYPDATLQREVPTSAELFDGNNVTRFQINCAVQMHGQAGRDNARSPKHSFRLEFKGDYGPSSLVYNWFGGGVSEFDSIVLRATWADTWTTRYDPFSGVTPPYTENSPLRYRPEHATYLRDIWVREAMRDMGHLASRSRHVHLYVNGLYWGIYNPSERLDTAFFANHLGGLKKDWDIVKDRLDFSGGFKAELQDGTDADWTNLIAFVNAGINSESAFQAVLAQIDVDNLIDYMLLHALVEANDWLQDSNPHNWFAARRRANPVTGLPGTKWIFLPWDQEIAMNRSRTEDRVNVSANHMPSRIYSQLRNWPEFRRMYGDRVQKHLFNGGALTASNNIARMQRLAAEIDRAMVGESARWGDARKFTINGDLGTGVTLTRDEHWLVELQKLYTNWYPNVMNQRLIPRLQAADLYPTIGAPQFSQHGGNVPDGFTLTISHTNTTGVIYFTVDGTDPRQYGTGALAPGAQAYSAPISINAPTLVKARVFASGNWSALVEAMFFTPQDFSSLALTEIMYNPPALGGIAGNNLEFLELKNTGTNSLNLSGLTFTSGITFTFPNGSILAPGAFFVLARDPASFAVKYPGVTVHGTYTGQLDNAGEQLTLSHPSGSVVFSVTYDDRPEWPVTPDVADFSLVQAKLPYSQAPDRGNRWRASTNPGGSPGADDPPPFIAPIVINEVLTHTDPPLKDSIELFNPTATNVNIGGWYLTDEPDTPKKFRIPNNTIIPAGGYIVFDADDFNASPGSATSFLLSSVGDDVHLFSASADGTLTGYSHAAVFGPSFNGVSFGRVVNSVGDEFFPQELARTLGSANAGPQIGPVVISELHYNPEPGGYEFVELVNITSNPVSLFSTEFPTNRWKFNGIDYVFPPNTVIGPNETILVISTSEANFRAKYDVPENVAIFGPYAGQLQNSGETIDLLAPDKPNVDAVPYVVMDSVRYNDRDPWPPAADGGGMSLQRSPVSAFGNDPAHWVAAAPTPGNAVGTSDSDGDGMPDAWEQENGTHVFIPDADEDPDHDGLTNIQEYWAGTHPNDAADVLQFEEIAGVPGGVSVKFKAVSNRTYSLLYKQNLSDPQWLKLADFAAHPTNRIAGFTNNAPLETGRFFRLVTPAQD